MIDSENAKDGNVDDNDDYADANDIGWHSHFFVFLLIYHTVFWNDLKDWDSRHVGMRCFTRKAPQ